MWASLACSWGACVRPRPPSCPPPALLLPPSCRIGTCEAPGRCDISAALGVASEKGRSWKDFTCVYFTRALFLDFSYFGLDF